MKKFLNPWVYGGTVLTASIILLVVYLVSGGLIPEEGPYQGGAEIVIIPVPTATPTLPPTMTPVPIVTPTSLVADGIQVGGHVQISGTEGEGLRLRRDPSLTGAIVYLGLEGEIFLVKGGPVEGDGYVWWELEAPLNTARQGWTVSNYLQPAQSP